MLTNASLVLRPASFRGRVKNLVKEIEAQASIRGNTVYISRHAQRLHYRFLHNRDHIVLVMVTYPSSLTIDSQLVKLGCCWQCDEVATEADLKSSQLVTS